MNIARLLKQFIILHEGLAHARNAAINIRVKIINATDPTLPDILSDIRAIRGVITVRELDILSEPNNEGRQFLKINVKYRTGLGSEEPLRDLAQQIHSIRGVDIVRVLSVEGVLAVDSNGEKIHVP